MDGGPWLPVVVLASAARIAGGSSELGLSRWTARGSLRSRTTRALCLEVRACAVCRFVCRKRRVLRRETDNAHFFGSSSRPALSECPRCAQSFCCSGVIGVGVSSAGTELHRIVSSNPGAEKTNVNAIGVAPLFFPLIH